MGKPISDAHKAAISAANKGRALSPEHRAKIAASNRGKKLSQETRDKLSAANKGKTMGAETRAKIAAANKGRRPSAEAIEKTAAAKRGKPRSPETRAKIAESLRGRKYGPQTAEWRQANSEGQRRLNMEPSYFTLHKRLAFDLAKQACLVCGRADRLHSALRADAPEERMRVGPRGLRYSLSVDDYVPLCARCHSRYDHGLLSLPT